LVGKEEKPVFITKIGELTRPILKSDKKDLKNSAFLKMEE
jgi:hypothetical protein